MSKGYTVNGQFFKTKDAIRKKLREILYAYPIGAKVTGEDSGFLLELLHNHPNAIEKIGCGIETFEVRQENSISRCFYLVRTDGTAENFSYKKCLNSPTPLAVFKSICRNLVYPQMHNLKSSYFREKAREDGCIRCPITGKWIAPEQAHVDHIPPDTFAKIVTGFIDTNSINVEKVEVREAEDVYINKTFVDESLAKNWVKYHDENAQLRVVSSFANLKVVLRREQALDRLANQYELSLIYELEPYRTVFLVDLALECTYAEWREQDFALLKMYASRLVGTNAAQPLLRPAKYEAVLEAFIDWLLPDEMVNRFDASILVEVTDDLFNSWLSKKV